MCPALPFAHVGLGRRQNMCCLHLTFGETEDQGGCMASPRTRVGHHSLWIKSTCRLFLYGSRVRNSIYILQIVFKWAHSFVDTSPTGDFALRQSRKESLWPWKPETFILWSLTEKDCWVLPKAHRGTMNRAQIFGNPTSVLPTQSCASP